MKVRDHIIQQATLFKYPGSIQNGKKIKGDENHIIEDQPLKWERASYILRDTIVPLSLKEFFYRTSVKSMILRDKVLGGKEVTRK